MIAKKTKRLIAVTLSAGVLAVGMTVAGAGVASATPGSCSTTLASDGVARGTCTSGTGQFRIGIPCKSLQTLGYGFTQYSGWRDVGMVASVGCPFGSWLWTDIPGGVHVILEKRNWSLDQSTTIKYVKVPTESLRWALSIWKFFCVTTQILGIIRKLIFRLIIYAYGKIYKWVIRSKANHSNS